MKKTLFLSLLTAGTISLALFSCGKSKTDSQQPESATVVDSVDVTAAYDCGIDFSKILVQVVNGDTTIINEYDQQGRLVKHGYLRDGEEGGDATWCEEITVYDERGDIQRTELHWGEWDDIKDYIYDSQHRLVEIKSHNGYATHYTWDGLTRTDDGFCIEQNTYSDNSYKHIINTKSYVSGNGPIASEYDYDLNGREISYKSYTDGILSSGWDTEYKDNKSIRYNIVYNPDGTVKSRTPDWVYEYIPDGKYFRVLSSHSYDGSEVGYTVEYDDQGREIATHGEYNETTTTWQDNVSTKVEDGITCVTTYMKTKK